MRYSFNSFLRITSESSFYVSSSFLIFSPGIPSGNPTKKLNTFQRTLKDSQSKFQEESLEEVLDLEEFLKQFIGETKKTAEFSELTKKPRKKFLETSWKESYYESQRNSWRNLGGRFWMIPSRSSRRNPSERILDEIARGILKESRKQLLE